MLVNMHAQSVGAQYKMQALQQALAPQIRHLLADLDPDFKSYKEAINRLEQKYGDPNLLYLQFTEKLTQLNNIPIQILLPSRN